MPFSFLISPTVAPHRPTTPNLEESREAHESREARELLRSQPTSTVLPSATLRPRDALDADHRKTSRMRGGGGAPELPNYKRFSAPSEEKCLLSLAASPGSCCCSRGPAQLMWERRDD